MKAGWLIGGALVVFGLGVVRVAAQSRTAVPAEPTQAGIGRQVGTLTGKGLNGKAFSVPVPGAKATVIALTSTTCPLCLKYGPTLASLEDQYAEKGVRFVFVNPSEIEPESDLRAQIGKLKLDGPYLHDTDHDWVRSLNAKTTTEVFVLDASGTLRYRGAVDDQYSIGATLRAPRNRFLADALNAVLAGKVPKVAATEAPGCLLNDTLAQMDATPTYHGRIEHLIQKSCLPCHREGGVAPFALDSYQAVKSRAKMLQYVVDEGIMPPWFAAKGSGPWRNDNSLSNSDKQALAAWIEGGTPKGDPAEAPKPIKFEAGWSIGKPDITFKLPKPVEVQATGVMEYVNITVPTNFTEDKWVQKIEVLPGNRRVVHHVLVFATEQGQVRQRGFNRTTEAIEELGGFFGAYVPGNSALNYPDGLAKRIPKGAVLRFQMHYTPVGEATTDQTQIGLVFAKEPPKSEVHTASLANLMFGIPPGASNHEVVANLTAPMDVQVLSFLPHMHVRGKAARYELTRDGKTQVLLDVPKYDFNWQLNYTLKTPLEVKKGDQMTFRAWYDNSENNPANPDPKRFVRWGSQTFDEMHLGYVEYIVPGEKPGENYSTLRPVGGGQQFIRQTFTRLDRNKDGFVTEEEAGPVWERIQSGDLNGDGKITLEEALKAFGG